MEKTQDLRYAVLTSDKIWDEVDNDDQYDLRIGHLTYFADKNIPQLLADFNDIEVTNTELGTLISLGDTFEVPEKIVQKAIQVRNILGAKGHMNSCKNIRKNFLRTFRAYINKIKNKL